MLACKKARPDPDKGACRMRWIRYVVLAAAVGAPQLCVADVLDGFVGHFPFDRVNGRTVYQVAKVRESMERLLGKQQPKMTRALRDFDRGVTIEALEDPKLGRLIYVFQCMKQVCTNQIALFLRPDGEAIAACLSQLDNVGSGTTTEWFGQGWRTTIKDCDNGCCTGAKDDEMLARLNAAKERAQGEDNRKGDRRAQ
jgi:hypothetical protein